MKRNLVKSAAPAGLSLHIGLNAVDPKHYGGWHGDLVACEFDANDMAAIARASGIKATTLLTKAATRARILAALRNAAKRLKAGDLFFLSYSGHGGQIPDVSGDEADKQDETWCLFDGQLIDDELYLELSKFAKGVRILVLSDSCHSGTVARAAPPPSATAGRSKAMPAAITGRTYRENREFYDDLQRAAAKTAGKAIDPDAALARIAVSNRLSAVVKDFGPAVVLISGCQDNQTSSDGDHNGAFTERLLQVWNQGAFKGNHAQFHARIVAGMPPSQTPNLFTLGKAAAFLRQAPFKV
ncbi:MAG: caspase family protein [Rhodocyclales bacterium]|nr:caspase family protein [Rhodocyclales bacterium]